MDLKRTWKEKSRIGKSTLPAAWLTVLLLAACGDRSYQTGPSEEENDAEKIAVDSSWPDPTWPQKVPEGPIDFRKHVRPILIINCLECHNRKDAPRNGNFILETRELAMTTGSAPPAIQPGDPDKSPLLSVMTLDPLHQRAMPPTPDKIWGVRLEILRRWIREGAVWPEDIRLVHPSEVTEW
ncbi:MAG: hypothetical protein KDN18_02480 [Verrucomicrobiae bacterium]|nr:hypothetical protein [Verrucomicrobiae bacterium]